MAMDFGPPLDLKKNRYKSIYILELRRLETIFMAREPFPKECPLRERAL